MTTTEALTQLSLLATDYARLLASTGNTATSQAVLLHAKACHEALSPAVAEPRTSTG